MSQCQANPAYAEKIARTLVNNWKLAKQIANFRGAEFLAILPPVISMDKPNNYYITEDFDGSDWLAVYPHVLQIKQNEQLEWIHDFTDSFDGPAFIYIDSCHTNNLGNHIIAQRISQILEIR